MEAVTSRFGPGVHISVQGAQRGSVLGTQGHTRLDFGGLKWGPLGPSCGVHKKISALCLADLAQPAI